MDQDPSTAPLDISTENHKTKWEFTERRAQNLAFARERAADLRRQIKNATGAKIKKPTKLEKRLAKIPVPETAPETAPEETGAAPVPVTPVPEAAPVPVTPVPETNPPSKHFQKSICGNFFVL
jgi:hypothetical protein